MPRFFIDRNLGAVELPRALRAAGWDIVTMREVYGERRAQVVKDPEWLKLVGDSEWIALMKDKHIRYRQAEIAALVKYRVRAFCLVRGGLTADQQNETFLRHQQQIFDASVAPGPFLYAVSATQVRRVDLE